MIFSRRITGIRGGAVEKLNVFDPIHWKIPMRLFKNIRNYLIPIKEIKEIKEIMEIKEMAETLETTETLEKTETTTIVANAEKGDVEKLGEMQEMHEWVMCPISYCIFRNPVLAEDGYLYEHDCIYRWFLECREGESALVSPLTKEKLGCSKLVPCQMARQMVAQYLTLYPDKRSNQYVCTFEMRTLMHYMYNSVNLGENYLRSVDVIALDKDITFQQMKRCVKIIHDRDPLLRISLWEAFFRKIEDIHIPFKNEKQEFTFEDIATEEGYEPGGGTWILNTLSARRIIMDLEDEELEESMARLSANPVLPVLQDSETREEGEIEETVVENGEEREEGEIARPPLERRPALTIDISATDSSNENVENDTERLPLVMRHLQKLKQEQQQNNLNYKRGLFGCLCFYANKRILESFLKVMPKITCPEIAGKYPHLIEDFFQRQHLMPERVRKMTMEERERLENILIWMIDKGIPYHGWTRNGKQTVLSMLYFALDLFHPGMFAKLQRKIINLPEFFLCPPGGSSGTLTAKEFLRNVLGKSETFYMALNVWDIYQKSNIMALEDIWDFCVKYSRHNIWNEEEWNRNSFYEKVLLGFVKARGSIPMDLVLLHTFSSIQLNHLFIEGYLIELPVGGGGVAFPKHEQILPPIIKEDLVFSYHQKQPPFDGGLEVMEKTTAVGPQKWKIQKHTPGGRLQISRRNYSTEWTWDSKGVGYEDYSVVGDEGGVGSGGEVNQHEKVAVSTIQPSPVMSILGWLIHHYDAPIVHQYLIQNKELEIDMNSVEFTGLEYVQPIHLVFRYYQFSKNVEELLAEMIRRGADLTRKTSHGWLPIHYACRYSPNLVRWILENIPGKEGYINAPICYQPSSQTVKIFEFYREWYKSYLPLELFLKNHTVNSANKEVLGLLILSGAKNANQLKIQECFKNQPFSMETPVVFEMGSGFGGSGNSEGNGGRISRKRK